MGLGRYPLATGSAAVLLLATLVPAAAKDCRMPKAPAGITLQDSKGCRTEHPSKSEGAASRERLQAKDGFVDLGGGTQVRISGRVRAEAGFRY
ncbi:hypothetical protein [Microvirga puerhi]|uniref:Porin n=1 Tax=Microvirga puerhi TaxID=2876078 RepID=A0ABS7VMS0_9HYPH|nr:hypothetical protein [Microvirga puerhi]MBZ6076833.1 hypothetical protein [Microvirga puerhi]